MKKILMEVLGTFCSLALVALIVFAAVFFDKEPEIETRDEEMARVYEETYAKLHIDTAYSFMANNFGESAAENIKQQITAFADDAAAIKTDDDNILEIASPSENLQREFYDMVYEPYGREAADAYMAVCVSTHFTSPPIKWNKLTDNMFGEPVAIKGAVAKVSQPQTNGNPTFIDIGEAYPSENRVSVVIWEEDIPRFDDVLDLQGKEVVIKGELAHYEDISSIEVSFPEQIEVLQ